MTKRRGQGSKSLFNDNKELPNLLSFYLAISSQHYSIVSSPRSILVQLAKNALEL